MALPAAACGGRESTNTRPAQTTHDASADASNPVAEYDATTPDVTDAASPSEVEASTDGGEMAAARDGGLRIVNGAPVCPSATDETCAFFRAAGTVFLAYAATPLPESITFPRRLKILGRHAATLLPNTGENETVFDVASSPPLSEKEVLALDHAPPGTFRHDTLPEEVVYDKGGGYTNCASGAEAGGSEPIALGYSALRTARGELLFQSTSALTRPNGLVEPVESKDDDRPFDLRWVEADCTPCGPRELRTVAIEVRMKGESAPLFKLLPGERKPLRIAGVDYTFRLNNASSHPDPRYCGTSGWAVYRTDLASAE